MPSWKKIIISGSNLSQLNNDSGYARTGSANTFYADQSINGNLVVTGSITALQYIISSSVIYITSSNFSGSNVFGNTMDDTHQFTGSVYITGSLIVSNDISGSLYGTASWANNAQTTSFAPNYVLNTATSSFITNSQTSSFVLNSQTSSFVTNNQTSSFITNSQTSSFVTNNQTSSFVTNSQTSSFVLNTQTSSFVTNTQTSSFVLNSQTSSFVLNSQTSSFVTNNQTSSFVTNSQTSSFVRNSQTSSMTVATASYVTGSIFTSTNPALSASFALTASYVNGSTTITNNTDNYVITATGTSALNGESTLTYNGTTLGVGVTTPLSTTKAHIKGILGIENGSTAGTLADQLLFGYNGSGLTQYNHKIQTSHDSQPVLNKMDFLVSNGASTFLNALTLRSSGLSRFDSGQGLGVSGSLQVTGSLNVTAGITGSLFGTASWSNRAVTASYVVLAQTASYVLQAVSSSFASTASYAMNVGGTPGGSDQQIQFNSSNTFAGTSSFTFNYQSQSLFHAEIGHARGKYSHAQGFAAYATGDYSHAEGFSSATGYYAHSEGNGDAAGEASHAEGNAAYAYGTFSHAEGSYTYAYGFASHAEGQNTRTNGQSAHSEGRSTYANGEYSHAEGSGSIADGRGSHAEGYFTTASGDFSHAEGTKILVYPEVVDITTLTTINIDNNGAFSVVSSDTNTVVVSSDRTGVGSYPLTLTSLSVSDSINTVSVNFAYYTAPVISNATYDGGSNTTTFDFGGTLNAIYQNIDIGNSPTTYGNYSHTEGFGTTTYGVASHAEGYSTIAYGAASHAGGQYTIASGSYQTVVGTYNTHNNTTDLFVVGGGTSEGNRKDVFNVSDTTITMSGSVNISGSLLVNGNSLPTIKSGDASATFAGNPLTASVVFGTTFPDNSYAITVTGEDARSWTIQSKSATGFTINSNSSVALSGATYWIATPFSS